jgi:hypothetical protein
MREICASMSFPVWDFLYSERISLSSIKVQLERCSRFRASRRFTTSPLLIVLMFFRRSSIASSFCHSGCWEGTGLGRKVCG